MGASNPFDTQVPFDILMRTTDDIVTIGAPSLLNVENLVRVVGILLVIVLIVGVWGWILRMKVQHQTETITAHAETEARVERHNTQLEMKRSRILEDINSSRPMPELIDAIAEMVAFSLDFPFCWCEMPDGVRLGNAPTNLQGLRSIRLDIPARAGGSLGTLFGATETGEPHPQDETSALEAGVRLATLAIETRRLYKDLVYRSEFDLLTDIHNRFSLDRYLEQLIEKSKVEGSIFGIVYVDLDEFKQVNDFYGHHIGDLYLQEVSTAHETPAPLRRYAGAPGWRRVCRTHAGGSQSIRHRRDCTAPRTLLRRSVCGGGLCTPRRGERGCRTLSRRRRNA